MRYAAASLEETHLHNIGQPRPGFGQQALLSFSYTKKKTWDIRLVCKPCTFHWKLGCLVCCAEAFVLPAGSVGENSSQPAQDVQDEPLSVLSDGADVCLPTKRVQQLLVEVRELQHCTALDPEKYRWT